MRSGEPGTGASVLIRRIRPEDSGAWRELRLRSLRLDPMAFGETLERVSQRPDSSWAEWANRAATSTDACSMVAVDAEPRLVGHIGSIWKDGVTLLGAMWVEPAYRRAGVGRRLLDAILTWADEAHPTSEVRLGVVPTQEAAVRLYRERGFVATGKISALEHTPGVNYHEMARRCARSNPDGPPFGRSTVRERT